MKIVFDADSLLYIAVARMKDHGTPYDAKAEFYKIVADITMEYEEMMGERAKTVIYAFSPAKTFRNELYDDYKAKRRQAHPWVRLLIDDIYLEDTDATMYPGLEADDVVIAMQKYYNYHIIASDKDVIMQAPGDVYEYRKRTHHQPKTDWEVASAIMQQALSGDTEDNIKGAKGIGKVKAKALVKEEWYIEDFLPLFEDEETMLLNMQLVSLHQIDEDFNVLPYESVYDRLVV
jgi:5'-3' exonuclease